MTERPYHHGNLRSALLDAAERTVRERGVQDLSLRELARDVGVSHGAPRRHFPDRQALLDALAETGFDRLRDELRTAVDAAGDDFEARLRATAAAYIRFATADPALLELMFAVKHREQAGALQEAAERAFSVMLEVILQGQAEGRSSPATPSASGSSCSRPSRGSPRFSPGAWWRPSSSTSCSTTRSRTSSAGRGPRSRS